MGIGGVFSYIIGSIALSVIANYIYYWLTGRNFLGLIVIRPFKIRTIKSSRSNSFKSDSNIVMWECGTIMCWVYVTPLGEGIRDLKNNRYIFGHITKADPNSTYYNRFSMGCLGKKGEKRWEVTLTNNDAKSSLLTIKDKLETGWHHFAISWNRKKKKVEFFIDKGDNGHDFKPISNWPEKIGENLVIGGWAKEHDFHYCNTSIAYPEIINKCLNCKSRKVMKSLKRKPVEPPTDV